jgi:hypothetical protein
MTESAFIAPKLTMRVGVIGHLAAGLDGHDQSQLSKHLVSILQLIKDKTTSYQDQNNEASQFTRAYQSGEPQLRLITNLAEGASMLGVAAARSVGYGIHAILPSASNPFQEYSAADEQLESHFSLNLDKAMRKGGAERRDAFRQSAYLMLAHIDVLIAIWSGEGANTEAGSTTDTIAEAQRRCAEIIWITPDGNTRRYTNTDPPERAWDSDAWDEISISFEQDAQRLQLDATLQAILKPPPFKLSGAKPDAKDAAHAEKKHEGLLLGDFEACRTMIPQWACFYSKLIWFLNLKSHEHKTVGVEKAFEEAELWGDSIGLAGTVGGEPFKQSITESLKERWERADAAAIRYANLYRSAFVYNFLMSAVAVVTGLLVLIVGDKSNEPFFKACFAGAEIAILASILFVAWLGNKNRWHEKWLTCRSIAEILRPSRLPFMTGGAPYRRSSLSGDSAADRQEEWQAWYIRASLREIPLPNGGITDSELRKSIEISIKEELGGQYNYHKGNQKKLDTAYHNLECLSVSMLFSAILVATVYIALYLVDYGCRADQLECITETKFSKYFKPYATFFAGALPVDSDAKRNAIKQT